MRLPPIALFLLLLPLASGGQDAAFVLPRGGVLSSSTPVFVQRHPQGHVLTLSLRQTKSGIAMCKGGLQEDRRRALSIGSSAAVAAATAACPLHASARPPPRAGGGAEERADAAAQARKKAQSQAPTVAHYSPAGGHCPTALIVVVGGFLIPPFQYDSYARALSNLGYAVRVIDPDDSLLGTKTIGEASRDMVSDIRRALQYEDELAFLRNSQMKDRDAVSSAQARGAGVQYANIPRVGPADPARKAFIKRMVRTELDSRAAEREREVTAQEGDTAAVQVYEGLAQGDFLPSVPLIFVGHSRGAKLCVKTAAAMKKAGRKVSCMVLLDPVDATQWEQESVFPTLARLGVPTAIVGAGADEGGCAPQGADYEAFYRTLGESGTPRLLAEIGKAGHMQFLDARKALLVDPCTVGTVDDSSVRELALSVAAAWVCSWSPTVVARFPDNEQEAVVREQARISKQRFYGRVAGRATSRNVVELLEGESWGLEVAFSSGGIGTDA